MTSELEHHAESLAGVAIVLDEENAPRRSCEPGARLRGLNGRWDDARYLDGERAPPTWPVAGGADAAAMQLDEPTHQSEADAETALSAVEGALALHEGLEDLRQQLGRNAEPIVAHTKHGLAVPGAECHPDYTARRRVLDRVRQYVGNDLIDAHRIAVDPVRPALDLYIDAPLLCARGKLRDAATDRIREVEGHAGKGHFARDCPSDLEQVVHEPRQVMSLAPDDVPRTHRRAVHTTAGLQTFERRGDGAERISQLMRQHRHELVLRLTALLGQVAPEPRIMQLAEVGDDQSTA